MSARQSARVGSEVADVANRPKKRPGSRERSSITTPRRTMVVDFRTIPKSYNMESRKREGGRGGGPAAGGAGHQKKKARGDARALERISIRNAYSPTALACSV